MIGAHCASVLTKTLAAILLLLCARVTAGQSPPAPDDPRPNFTAIFGLGRLMMPERWNAVRIEISGGAVPFDGMIRVAVGSGASTELVATAPFGATPGKTTFVDLAVPLNAVQDYGDDRRRVSIELLDNRGRRFRAAEFTADGRGNTVPFNATPLGANAKTVLAVGTMSLRRAHDSWASGPGADERWSMVSVGYDLPESLPTVWMAYDAWETVVLTTDATLRLDGAQRSALAEWVAAGGSIVLIVDAARADLGWLLGEPTVDLIPGPTEDRLKFGLTTEGEFRGWTIRDLESPAGSGMRTDEPGARGVGAIAEGILGGGWVTLIVDDPIDIYPWGEPGALWREVLSVSMSSQWPVRVDPWNSMASERRRATDSVLNIAAAGMGLRSDFPILPFGGVLITLALLVGPVDRLVLRRLRLTRYAWLSALVWIGVVAGAGYIAPRLLRASDSEQHRLVATDINTLDGHASRSGLVSFFAGRTGARSVEGTDPRAWWLRASTSRNPWDSRPVSSITLYTDQRRGSTPTMLPMGVWTLNFLMDESRVVASASGRLVLNDRGRPERLELEGIPAVAPGVLVAHDARSYAATHHAGGVWTLDHADHSLADRYGLGLSGVEYWPHIEADQGADLMTAALWLPGASRRGHSIERAAGSPSLAVVYATLVDQPSDVSVTLGGEAESDRRPRTEVVRMLIPVVTQENRP